MKVTLNNQIYYDVFIFMSLLRPIQIYTEIKENLGPNPSNVLESMCSPWRHKYVSTINGADLILVSPPQRKREKRRKRLFQYQCSSCVVCLLLDVDHLFLLWSTFWWVLLFWILCSQHLSHYITLNSAIRFRVVSYVTVLELRYSDIDLQCNV